MTLSNCNIARSDLLRYVDYPDSVSGSDRVAMTYNRLGQMKARTDQRGVVRDFLYDKLGRLSDDCVTNLGGTGVVDSAVRRVSRAYEVRGMVSQISSYDSGTVGSGNLVNQVQLDYNEFSQLSTEWQAHTSAGVSGTTPNV